MRYNDPHRNYNSESQCWTNIFSSIIKVSEFSFIKSLLKTFVTSTVHTLLLISPLIAQNAFLRGNNRKSIIGSFRGWNNIAESAIVTRIVGITTRLRDNSVARQPISVSSANEPWAGFFFFPTTPRLYTFLRALISACSQMPAKEWRRIYERDEAQVWMLFIFRHDNLWTVKYLEQDCECYKRYSSLVRRIITDEMD